MTEAELRRMLVNIISKCPTVGLTLSHIDLKLEPASSLPEAYGWTDGRTIALRDDLQSAGAEAVFWHELLHVLNEHIPRGRGKDISIWNIAADIWVNAVLREFGFQLPPGTIQAPPCISNPESMSVEEIYNILLRHSSQLSPPTGARTDLHKDGQGKGQEKQKTSSPSANQADSETSATIGKLTHEDLDGLRRQLAEDLRRLMGELPAGWQRELSQAQGQMSWQEVLQRFIINTIRHKFVIPPVRKNLIPIASLPVRRKKHPPLAIAVDTSGSIRKEELFQFVAEIKSILSILKSPVLLISCDAAIQDEFTVSSVRELLAISSLKGGGGTDFRPVFERLKEKEEDIAGLIFFTDTFGTYPDDAPEYPVLWVVPSVGNINMPPFGEIIWMRGD